MSTHEPVQDWVTVTRPGALPGAQLELEPMPPLIHRRCNVCQAPLARHQKETCSPECRALWRSICLSLGLPVAKRLLTWQMHRREKPMPDHARRAFSELTQLGRHNLARLRQLWVLHESVRND